jgi:hypothetical protein
VSAGPLTVTLGEEKDRVRLAMQDGSVGTLSLGPAETDELIKALAGARMQLSEPVAAVPPQEPGKEEVFILNPAWRVDDLPQASVQGVMLRLRHPGLGWVNLVVPYHEARALGHWLLKLSPVPSAADDVQTRKDEGGP